MPKEKGISLKPMKFESALRGLLQTPPPPSSKKAKTISKRKAKK
jgi:hypothetical protein